MGKTTRRAFLGRVAGAGGIGLGAALGVLGGMPGLQGGTQTARAQPTDEPAYGAWEQVPLNPGLRVNEIFTPTSGALLAATARSEGAPVRRLWRSDDGGRTWRELALPPVEDGSQQVTVDPTDHTVAYALAQGVLHRSMDDAASWQPLTSEALTQAEIRNVPIVSRADPSLLYLVAVWGGRPLRILRSRDRGESWEVILDGTPTSLKSTDWGTRFLFPHPTDASRVYLGLGYGGVTPPADDVRVSTDQGATWQSGEGPTGYDGWVGGFGAAAGAFCGTRRVYGPSDPNTRGTSAIYSRPRIVTLERGSAEGTGWVPVQEIARVSVRDSDPDVALAADPTVPDRLFISVARGSTGGTSEVRVSLDGGQSWRVAGTGGPASASQLAVGMDGKTVFATDQQGALWRLPLG